MLKKHVFFASEIFHENNVLQKMIRLNSLHFFFIGYEIFQKEQNKLKYFI